jgi:hypothetical protein
LQAAANQFRHKHLVHGMPQRQFNAGGLHPLEHSGNPFDHGSLTILVVMIVPSLPLRAFMGGGGSFE